MARRIRIKPTIITLSRYILALLFIFSGFAKSINPFGMSIQIEEYLNALNIGFLSPLSLIGAILLPASETILGLILLLNLGKKLSAWAVMIFMSFFTILTLWIAIFNPVSDCGCFGDLIKMSNWGTFAKNILLMPLALILFLDRNNGKPGKSFMQKSNGSKSRKTADPLTIKYIAIIVASLILPIYTINSLPIIDATPYKIGVNIPQAMNSSNEANNEYHTIVIYKNIQNGTIQEFEVDDTTWYDSNTWEYVDSKTTVINDNIKDNDSGKISSLPMLKNGNDIAMEILNKDDVQALFIIPMWSNLNENLQTKMLELIHIGNNKGINSIILTADDISNAPEAINRYMATNPDALEILNSDHTVLKTMIQSRYGGLILIENGTIINKWSAFKLPHSF